MQTKHASKTDLRGILRSHSMSNRCSTSNFCSSFSLRSLLKTVTYCLMFYTFSISLTFFNKYFIHQFRFPLSITLTHLITKFVLAAFFRGVFYCKTGKKRVTLGWLEYLKRVAPAGITGSLDIGLSNWSFAFITVSLYTMTKTTAIIFIFCFSVLFRLEKPRCSLIIVVLFIAVGLFMFTFESTQFNGLGFSLVLLASFISGMRWTLAQIVLQRSDIGLSNPIDMMYHIQPWMILSLLPLSTLFEGLYLATSENGFAFQDGGILLKNLMTLFFGAFLAFMLELSEFLVVSHASSLTLSVAGILKELITVLLATLINDDQISPLNAAGLVICLAGITLHVILKALNDENDNKSNKASTESDQRELLNAEDMGSSDSSDEYVLYTQSRKR